MASALTQPAPSVSKTGTTPFEIFVLIVFFFTPHIPMPIGGSLPYGPMIYLFLTGILILVLLLRGKLNLGLTNGFSTFFYQMSFLLALSDILKMCLFVFSSEMLHLPIRITNIGIYSLFAYVSYSNIANSSYEEALGRLKMVKVFYYSLLVLGAILCLQAFGYISTGKVYSSRDYFNIVFPFKKPFGLVPISDGKIGCMLGPCFFLGLLVAFKRTRFTNLPFGLLMAVFMFVNIIIGQSRSTYLGFLVSFSVFCFLSPYKIFRQLFVGSGISIAIMLLVTGWYKLIWIGLVGEGIYEKNVEGRGLVTANAFKQFFSSPLFGVGHKGLLVATGHDIGTHNLFTDHMGSGGILAIGPFLLIFLSFYWVTIRVYLKTRKNGDYKMHAFCIWLICSMIHNIIELNLYRGFYNEYTYFLLVMASMVYYLDERQSHQRNVQKQNLSSS